MTGTAPQPIWQPFPDTVQGGLSFGLGAIYYASGETGLLQAIDYHTGQLLPGWAANTQPAPAQAWQTPLYTNLGGTFSGLYTVDDNGNLYSINLADGSVVWTVPVNTTGAILSVPVVATNFTPGGDLPWAIYLADTQNVYCVQIIAGEPSVQTVYTSDSAINPSGTPVYDVATQQIFILEGTSGAITGNAVSALAIGPTLPFKRNWSLVCDATPTESLTPPTLFGGSLYVCDSESQLHILSTSGTPVAISASLTGTVETAPPVQQVQSSTGTTQIQVFVPTDKNFLYCLDGATGSVIWATQPMGDDSQLALTAAVLSDGNVYVGGANGSIYGIPTDDPSEALSYATGDDLVGIAGVSNGTVYFGLANNGIMAVDFDDVLKCFQVECDLIQDFADTPGTVTQVPTFHAHVSLFAPTGTNGALNPAAGEVVQIAASQDVTITVNSTQTYDISSTVTANLTADPNGVLIITIPANTTATTGSNQSSGLSCPMLTLWGSFMATEELLVIYPDQPLHDNLATIQGPALQNMAGYGTGPTDQGPTILPSNFQGTGSGQTNAGNLASAINSAFGQKTQTVTQQSPYLAPRPSSNGVGVSASPTQPMRSANTQNFAFTLSSNGTTTFTNDPNAVAAEVAAIRRRVGPITDDLGIFDWIDDAINDAENFVLQSVTCIYDETANAINAVINAIVQGVESAYNFAVNTVEDAANVVLGVLSAIGNAIEDVVDDIVQALSFLFAWGDIVNTMNGIAGSITSALGSLQTDIATIAGSDVQTFFTNLENSIAGAFGSPSIVSAGQNAVGSQNQDPSSAYSKGGGSSVACTSFTQKTSNNMSGSGSSTGTAAFLTVLDTGNFGSQMATFFTNAQSILSSQFPDLGASFTTALTNFGNALVDPSTFQSSGINALLSPIGVIAQDIVAFFGAIAQDFLTLLQNIGDDLLGFFTAPIEIPLIGDIFSWMAGGATFNLLNLFSLLVAIPMTIVYKAVNGSAPFSDSVAFDAGSYDPGVAQVVYSFAMVLYGVFEGLNDAWPFDVLRNYFLWPSIALNIAVLVSLRYTYESGALFTPPASTHNDWYYGLNFAPFVFTIYATVAPAFSTAINYATTGCGFILLAYSIYLADAYPETYLEPEIASLLGNIFSCVSPIDKALPIPSADRAAIDLCTDIGAGIFNIPNWGSSNGLG